MINQLYKRINIEIFMFLHLHYSSCHQVLNEQLFRIKIYKYNYIKSDIQTQKIIKNE